MFVLSQNAANREENSVSKCRFPTNFVKSSRRSWPRRVVLLNGLVEIRANIYKRLQAIPLRESVVVFVRRKNGASRDRNKTPASGFRSGHLVLATSYSRTAYRRTTIGAAAFHCRVRNGNGWGHCAIVTRNVPRKLPRHISGA